MLVTFTVILPEPQRPPGDDEVMQHIRNFSVPSAYVKHSIFLPRHPGTLISLLLAAFFTPSLFFPCCNRMTPQQSNLDLSGDFRAHPFAELLIEIVQAKLTGSLRIARDSKKTIIYFRDGAIVFGVSNLKEYRLFHRLLKDKLIQQADLHNCPGLGNDMELAAWLQNKNLLTAAEINDSFVSQIGDIIVDGLTWPDGQWIFSASARLRSDVDFRIEIYNLLLDYARCVPGETVMGRFMSVHEAFVRQIDICTDLLLQPQEACVLEAFGSTPLKFDELRNSVNMPESGLAQALYALWLG